MDNESTKTALLGKECKEMLEDLLGDLAPLHREQTRPAITHSLGGGFSGAMAA